MNSKKTETKLLPLSPMDALMNDFKFVILYIFPPSSSPYSLDKLQSSFVALVEQEYPILIGELYVDPKTGIVHVRQSNEHQQPGAAKHIRFEKNPTSSMTTEEAMQKRSLELMPTTRGEKEVICLKGTLLADGGLAIGVDISHVMFDGEAMFTFMTVWGQHYSGVKKEYRLVVNHERHLLRGTTGSPANMAHPEFRIAHNVNATSPSLPPTAYHLFHFTPAMMKKIKEVTTGCDADSAAMKPSYVSTIDSITALFTVLISRARGHRQEVRVSTGVNARQRLNPHLPANYAGNVIFNALSTYSTSDLYSEGETSVPVLPATLGKIARRVRESINHYEDFYLRDALNFVSGQGNIGAVKVACNFFYGPDILFTSWLHLGMYNAEFDGTHPWYACVPCPCCDGIVMVTEAQKHGDGIDVGVFLECSVMEKLKKLFLEVSYLYQ